MINVKNEILYVITKRNFSLDNIVWMWVSVIDIPINNNDDLSSRLGDCYEYYKDTDNIEEYLKQLNFDYDDGYGTQYIDGIIMFDDNSWYTRNEYDGSEWWEYVMKPISPKEQRKIKEENESKN